MLWCCSLIANGQERANQWVFGGNNDVAFNGTGLALDFSSGTGELIDLETPYISREACASICNKDGELLFYTDGTFVYNRNHDTMPNGRTLDGWYSCTQGALIVPFPEDETRYYIFTQTDWAREDGFRYSVVDMTLDNGLGDVVPSQRNIPLLTPVSEKMTAVHHKNCRDVWVIVHKYYSREFYAYLVTPEGIEEPVVTEIGGLLGYNPGNVEPGYGSLKVSHRGEWLAMGRWYDTIDLYRFDVETGVVSDYKPLISPSVWLNFRNVYGMEFSPDDTKLYVGTFQGGQMFQFDLNEGTAEAISANVEEMDHCFCVELGHLQLGPDGRIYVTREDSKALGVIENPNQKYPGAKYIRDAIPIMEGKALGLSFPNFVQSQVMDFGCVQEPPPVDTSSGWFAIPNAFSPNADGYNNTFGPVFRDYAVSDYRMTIYNRWGEKLFESDTPEIRWDGRYRGEEVQMDAYMWLIRFRHDRKLVSKSGTVTVVR